MIKGIDATNLIITIWAFNIWMQLISTKGELKRIADALEKREESEEWT